MEVNTVVISTEEYCRLKESHKNYHEGKVLFDTTFKTRFGINKNIRYISPKEFSKDLESKAKELSEKEAELTQLESQLNLRQLEIENEIKDKISGLSFWQLLKIK